MIALLRMIPGLGWWFKSHLINFGITFQYIKVIRLCYIGGRPGGYKTALAFRIAYKLWESSTVENIYSNIDCVWNDDVELLADAPDPKDLRLVAIFDEAGQFFEGRRDVKQLVAFLRKMKIILLMPSVEPPTRRVTQLSIEPHYIFTTLGIPCVLYRTVLRGQRRSDDRTSYFFWWRPSEMFGLYDTKDAPVSGGGLDHALVMLKDRMAKKLAGDSRYAGLEAVKQARKGGMIDVELFNALPDVSMDGGGESEAVDRFEELADDFGARMDRFSEGLTDEKAARRGMFS